ncbi:MAG: leucyl aminopeptidase [Holophagales bacterium]|jgi:leucyl aminopeptidase|nr:leucyl aminopeptidase [Holophagales bacterium]
MSKIEISAQSGKDFTGDALIVPVFSGRERHRLPLAISKVARLAMDEGDFKAEYLETVPLHRPNGVKGCRWILLAGLGEEEKVTLNKIRKTIGAAVRFCMKKGWKSIGLLSPTTSNMGPSQVQTAALEGALLADYDFSDFRSKPEATHLERIEVFTNNDDNRKLRRHQTIIEIGVAANHLVRDLVNTPAADMHPDAFTAKAKSLAAENKIAIDVLSPEELEKGGFRALLAVGKGSAHQPRVIKLDYTPSEKAKKHIVLVGKGVCFDSGGLSLKDATNMETMKDDMAGAAVALATTIACAKAGVPVKVTAICGLVENMPGGSAYKPGDILRSRSGKTIEVLNTDAEGRLVLADLLHWASELGADHVIDLATLTGACLVALGDGVSGVFGTDQRLVERMLDAGASVGEHLWNLPLVEEYRELLKSNVADIKNITSARWGGAITAALFLKEFVGASSWAHVDLSSVWTTTEKDYRTAGGTGEGPRWLLELIAGQL